LRPSPLIDIENAVLESWFWRRSQKLAACEKSLNAAPVNHANTLFPRAATLRAALLLLVNAAEDLETRMLSERFPFFGRFQMPLELDFRRIQQQQFAD
jgi:hypothetical protein